VIPAVVLMDRTLPDGDGLTACSNMKQDERYSHIPIIFLSGLATEIDKVSGFFAGADDYVSKPFSSLELRARIDARLKSFNKKINIADIQINLEQQKVYQIKNEDLIPIDLTRIEYKLLCLLANAQDKIFNRQQIIDKVWGTNNNVCDRAVDTHVSHLRKKLSNTEISIESLRGEGYRLTLTEAKTQLKAA